jgi:hypothetical protein
MITAILIVSASGVVLFQVRSHNVNSAMASDISFELPNYPPPLPTLPLWFYYPDPSAHLQRQFSGKLKQASMVGSLLTAVQEFAASNIEMFLRSPSASFGRHSHS